MATMVNLAALGPLMQPFAAGCPAPLLELNARLAAVEMCERTRCWRHRASVTMTAGGVSGEVVPAQATIYEIEEASIAGRPLTPVQFTDMTGAVESGEPRYITQAEPGQITIFPWSDQLVGPVTVDLSLFLTPRTDTLVGQDPDDPMRDAFNVVPSFLIQRHGERLADGALARVLMMEGEPWFNPQRAAVHAARFEDACTRNAHVRIYGQQRARTRTRYHDF